MYPTMEDHKNEHLQQIYYFSYNTEPHLCRYANQTFRHYILNGYMLRMKPNELEPLT